jgi:hypothetical protein
MAALALGAGSASANQELLQMQRDPNQWVMPTGNYASWRYSELNQINRETVRNLRPSWQFSTGVLRGHEGGPLVVGDMMYVHTPFPNRVFAHGPEHARAGHLALRAAAGPDRHRRDVLRHREPRPRPTATARSSSARRTPPSSRSTPRPARKSGRSRTATPPKARPRRWRR